MAELGLKKKEVDGKETGWIFLIIHKICFQLSALPLMFMTSREMEKLMPSMLVT